MHVPTRSHGYWIYEHAYVTLHNHTYATGRWSHTFVARWKWIGIMMLSPVFVCLLLLSLCLYQVHLWPYIYHIHSLIIVQMRISLKIKTMPIFIGTLLEFSPGNSIQGASPASPRASDSHRACLVSSTKLVDEVSLGSVRLWVSSTRQLILQVSGILGVYGCVDAQKLIKWPIKGTSFSRLCPWHQMLTRSECIDLNPTPLKIDMEATNHPFRKEHHLPNLHDYVPC